MGERGIYWIIFLDFEEIFLLVRKEECIEWNRYRIFVLICFKFFFISELRLLYRIIIFKKGYMFDVNNDVIFRRWDYMYRDILLEYVRKIYYGLIGFDNKY